MVKSLNRVLVKLLNGRMVNRLKTEGRLKKKTECSKLKAHDHEQDEWDRVSELQHISNRN